MYFVIALRTAEPQILSGIPFLFPDAGTGCFRLNWLFVLFLFFSKLWFWFGGTSDNGDGIKASDAAFL